jgi:preprotein translocase subunit SecB
MYDAKKPSDVSLDDLEVESSILPPSSDGDWTVVLSVEQHTPISKNAPYGFSLQLWGYFEVVAGVPRDRAEQLVLTNGSSILFAAAREIVRDMTSKGPHPPLLLPTLSFFPLPKEEAAAEVGEAAKA